MQAPPKKAIQEAGLRPPLIVKPLAPHGIAQNGRSPTTTSFRPFSKSREVTSSSNSGRRLGNSLIKKELRENSAARSALVGKGLPILLQVP